jgi:hypothetical protein
MMNVKPGYVRAHSKEGDMDGTASRRGDARAAASDLLKKMETDDLPIDRLLLQAKRVARLLRDTDAQVWLDLEIGGYPDAFDPATLGNCLQYARAAGRITSDGTCWPTSLPRLEAACTAERQRVESASPKPSTTAAKDYVAAGATTKMFADQMTAFSLVKDSYLQVVGLYSSLKAAIHAYVTDSLISIEFGDIAESFFDELRGDVDSFVRSHSPKSAEKLTAIAERMADGSPEACAEALTTCRRLLMTIADSVFPPSEVDWVDGSGQAHKVGRDNYMNRLAAFLESRLTSDTTRAIVKSELEHLGSRLEAVYEKASKGVHTDVSVEEARLAIVEAYLLLGEIARLQQS